MRLILTSAISLIFWIDLAFAGGFDDAAFRLSRTAGISQQTAHQEIERVFEVLKAEMLEGREVVVKGFGRFYVKERGARKGRNPKTGAPLDIPARRYPRFISAAVFKAALNTPAAPLSISTVSIDAVHVESSPQSARAPRPNASDPLVLPR